MVQSLCVYSVYTVCVWGGSLMSALKSIRVHLVPGSKMYTILKHSDIVTG